MTSFGEIEKGRSSFNILFNTWRIGLKGVERTEVVKRPQIKINAVTNNSQSNNEKTSFVFVLQRSADIKNQQLLVYLEYDHYFPEYEIKLYTREFCSIRRLYVRANASFRSIKFGKKFDKKSTCFGLICKLLFRINSFQINFVFVFAVNFSLCWQKRDFVEFYILGWITKRRYCWIFVVS